MTYNTHLKENISLLQHIKVLYCPLIFKYGFGSLEYQIQRGHHLALQIPLSFLGDGFHHMRMCYHYSWLPQDQFHLL